MPRSQRTNLPKNAAIEVAQGFEGTTVNQAVVMPVMAAPKSSGQQLAESMGLVAKIGGVFAEQAVKEEAKENKVQREVEAFKYAQEYTTAEIDRISQLPIEEQQDAYTGSLMAFNDRFANSAEEINPHFYAESLRNVRNAYTQRAATAGDTARKIQLEEDKFGVAQVAIDKAVVEPTGGLASISEKLQQSGLFVTSKEALEESTAILTSYIRTQLGTTVVENGKSVPFIGSDLDKRLMASLRGTSKDGVVNFNTSKAVTPGYAKLLKQRVTYATQVRAERKRVAVEYKDTVTAASFKEATGTDAAKLDHSEDFKDQVNAVDDKGVPYLSRAERTEALDQYDRINSAGEFSTNKITSLQKLREIQGKLYIGEATIATINGSLKELTLTDRKAAYATHIEVTKTANAADITYKKGIIREEISQYFSNLGYSKNVLMSLSGKGEEGHKEHAIRSKVNQSLIAWLNEPDEAGEKTNTLIKLDVKTIQEMIGKAGTAVNIKPHKGKGLTPDQTSNVADLTAQEEQKSTGYINYIFDWLGYEKSRD